MPIVIPVHTTTRKEVNCIIEQGIRYCEKPLGSDISQTMISGILVAIILWSAGLVYVVNRSIDREELLGVFLYIISAPLIWFILTLIK